MSYIGTTKIGGVYLGGTKISKAYLGEDLVYSAGPPPVIEMPDWIRIDISAPAGGATFQQTSFGPNMVEKYILDGGQETSVPIGNSWGLPLSEGEHIVYFKPKATNAYYVFAFSSNYNGVKTTVHYVRLPYNIASLWSSATTTSCGGNCDGILEILDPNKCVFVSKNSWSEMTKFSSIVVPTGSKELYNGTAIYSKVKERNFNYEIPE